MSQTTCRKQNATDGGLKQSVGNKMQLTEVSKRLRETKHNWRRSQTTCGKQINLKTIFVLARIETTSFFAAGGTKWSLSQKRYSG
ncbi:hypothetical protein ACFP3I_13085 [Chryseobacterium arachidis]|uniref:hypothetical protein n=1 Tax=Chryseobacterium arachidis TaxID=1416778 RepID=UPI003615A835